MMSQAVKSLSKLLLKSRPSVIKPHIDRRERLIIMGNGPSLGKLFETAPHALANNDTMAVNFAANTPQFFDIKPVYYTIADPHFYQAVNDPNVARLIDNLNRVDWPMQLFVPHGAGSLVNIISNPAITITKYNAVGIEGWNWLRNLAYNHHWGMPRPRNVLIPSIMIGAWLGYKDIYITGADHSWTQSLSVDNENRVITNLPHFYADNEQENARIKAVYANIPLHSLFLSYHIAFKAYHEIASWAQTQGINIYNATPGSFIDAFPRRSL